MTVVSETSGQIALYGPLAGGSTPTFADDQISAFEIFREEKQREKGEKVHMGLTHLIGKSFHN